MTLRAIGAVASVETTLGNVELIGTATVTRMTHVPGDVAGIDVAVGVGLEVRRDDVVARRNGVDEGVRPDENHRRERK